MFKLMMFMLMSAMFPLLLISVSIMINARSSESREKLSPFECGFDPKSTARIPFSLRFFLLAVLFLVFDIEIVLLLGAPLSFSMFSIMASSKSFIAFILVLIMGLAHEWNEGSLEWSS